MPSILIQVNPAGHPAIQTDMNDKLQILGLLDVARHMILTQPMKQEPKVELVNPSSLRMNGLKPS